MSIHSPRLAVSNGYSAANYLPAILKTNQSGWIIEYYVENPQTQMLARKKIKLQRLLCRYPSKRKIKCVIPCSIVAHLSPAKYLMSARKHPPFYRWQGWHYRPKRLP